MAKLEDFLKVLLTNWLKISPKKCWLFSKELQYIGNTVFIKEKRDCVKLLRSRLEAIQKLVPQTPIKSFSFIGMLNFQILLCPDLQKLLQLIHDFTRKSWQLILRKEQNALKKIARTTLLHLPDSKSIFHLYSATSKFATGSILIKYTMVNKNLIAYASKRVPKAVENYSIRELEL